MNIKQQKMYDLNVEAAVLSACLIDEEAIVKVIENVDKNDFYTTKNKLIFQAIQNLFKRNQSVDMLTVIEDLKRQKKLAGAGGTEYISEISEIVCTGASVTDHISIIRDYSNRRKLNLLAHNIHKNIKSGDSSSKIIDGVENSLQKIHLNSKSELEAIGAEGNLFFKELEEKMKNKNLQSALPTGYFYLDDLLGGLQKTQYVVVAGRPSMGKTALALNVVINLLKIDKSIAFFSLEMRKKQLYKRLLAIHSGINHRKIKSGNLTQGEVQKLQDSGDFFSEKKLFVDEGMCKKVSEIKSKALLKMYGEGLDLVVIDYLQLLSYDGFSTKREKMTEVSREIKLMALALDVPVIVLSQLNRASENRTNNRPKLADLRETGAIEQDADIVALLFREDYYYNDSQVQGNNIAELIIPKNRDGATGVVKLSWVPELMKFNNINGE